MLPSSPQPSLICSINDFERDNLATYGLLAGIINAGLNLGSALAPAVAGTITQYLGYAWTTVAAAGLCIAMVSNF